MENRKHRRDRAFREAARGEHGIITVMLSLLIIPVIIFTGVVADLARVKLIEAHAVTAVDMYSNSILAAFDNDLLDMYALFGYESDEDREKLINTMSQRTFDPAVVSDDSEFQKLIKDIKARFSQREVLARLYAGTKADFSYEIAKNESGIEGNLGNNAILRTQISDYATLRLPVYLAEYAIDSFGEGVSDIEKVLQATQYVNNISEYNKLVNLKTKIDSKIENFYTYLQAYFDDLYALKPNNFESFDSYNKKYYAKSGDLYGLYGVEEAKKLIGEITSLSDRNTSSYVTPSVSGFSDAENDNFIHISEYYSSYIYDTYEDLYSTLRKLSNPFVPDPDNPDVKIFSPEIVSACEESALDCIEALLDLEDEAKGKYDYCEKNMYRLYKKINNENYYRKDSMLSLGRTLDEKKVDIEQLLAEFDRECELARENGVDADTIKSMSSGYDTLKIFTSSGFAYEEKAKEYTDNVNDIIYGTILNHPGGINSINASLMDNDYEIIRDDLSKLRDFCHDIISYAGDQMAAQGLAPMPAVSIANDSIRRFAEYNAYYIDQMNLFGHENVELNYKNYSTGCKSWIGNKDYTFAMMFYNSLRNISDSVNYNLNSYRREDIKYYYGKSSWGCMTGNNQLLKNAKPVLIDGQTKKITYGEFYDYLYRTMLADVKDNPPTNTYLSRAKDLLNQVSGITLDSFGINPTYLNEDLADALKLPASESKDSDISAANLLDNAGSLTSGFQTAADIGGTKNSTENPSLSRFYNNIALMMYDYYMFSCNTTDRVYMGKDNSAEGATADSAEKNDGGLGQIVLSKDETDTSTDIDRIADNKGEKMSQSSISAEDAKKQEDKKSANLLMYEPVGSENREKSWTGQTFYDTSAFYYRGDKDNVGLGGGELEYIFGGTSYSMLNSTASYLTIMTERMVFNYISTYTIKELNSVIVAVRDAVSACFTPVAGVITEAVLRLAIAAVETLADMIKLLSAGEVVLLKSALDQLSCYSLIADLIVNDPLNDNGGAIEGSGANKVNLNKDKYHSTEKSEASSIDLSKEKTPAGGTTTTASKIPVVKMSYKQYLILNILIFTDRDKVIERTRDLIDLNMNMKRGLIERKESRDTDSFEKGESNGIIKFKSGSSAESDNYFRLSECITTIDATCEIQMQPLFTSLQIGNLSDDSDSVEKYLSDIRTFSVTRGY